MILPTGTTVAVADGETFRLFHNTGVKRGVHLVEIAAAPPCDGVRSCTTLFRSPMLQGALAKDQRLSAEICGVSDSVASQSSMAVLASEAGHADQPHLVRERRRISGSRQRLTPHCY